MSLPPCRFYQMAALEKGRACIANGAQAVLLCMPTGTGKTRTAVQACSQHAHLGGLPMFVAPRRELVKQAEATLIAIGMTPDHDVFVRTIQELTMPGAEIPPATLVVLDEARHYVADAWSELRTKLPEAVYLGLDATPERGDGRGLGGMFDVLIEAISVKEAIASGFLVPCDVLRPDRMLGPRELAQDPLDAYKAHAYGTSAVLFASSVELAKDYARRFSEVGITAAAVWGDMPTASRDHALAEYAAGRIRVLTNVALLTEGWDAPLTETVILAAGCGTAGGYLQRVGRGMRPVPGKKRMILLDLRGVSHVFGDPDELRMWHLDGKAARRASDDIEIRFCPVCGAPTATKECEQCGYAGSEMKKRRPRVLGLPIDRFARQRAQSEEEMAKTLARWIGVARSKGYRLGWAYAKWSAVYGRPVSSEMKRAALKLA